MSESSLITSMSRLIEKFDALYSYAGDDWPMIEKDEQWISPCEIGPQKDEFIGWKPVRMESPVDFSALESALHMLINDDIKAYYSFCYSEGIRCRAKKGELDLILIWNDDDFARLQENIIGHLLMKQKMKQRATIFFAHTDEDDLFLSVLNTTGEVVLERPGKEPHEVLSPDLATFIDELEVVHTEDK